MVYHESYITAAQTPQLIAIVSGILKRSLPELPNFHSFQVNLIYATISVLEIFHQATIIKQLVPLIEI